MTNSGRRARLVTVLLAVVLTGSFLVTGTPIASALPDTKWWETPRRCDVDAGCYPNPDEHLCTHSNDYCIPGIHPTVALRGLVTDALGRPIQGARVYWRYGSTYTGSDGRYTVTVWADDDVYLIATHTSFVWTGIPIDNPIIQATTDTNFTLPYLLYTSMSQTIFNNTPAKSLQLEARTTAPATEVSVVMRMADGDVLQAAHTFRDEAGFEHWALSWTVPEGTPDGQYKFTACVVASESNNACTSGTGLLTWVVEKTYTIDSIAPVFDPSSLSPNEQGVTVFPQQRLSAKLSDERSGIDHSTVVFKLYDETAGSSSNHHVNYYSSWSQWAQTSSISLVPGHVYSFEVVASDFAGNRARVAQVRKALGGGFLASNHSVAAATAAIATIPCQLNQMPDWDGTRTATCPNVTIGLQPSTVTLDGTSRGGTGFVIQEVPLSSAIMKNSLGLTQSAQNWYYPGWYSHRLSQRFDIASANSDPLTVPTQAASKNIGTLQVKVPAAWPDAFLEMPATQAWPRIGACEDSSWGLCSPDPLRHDYIVEFKASVTNPSATADELTTAWGAVKHSVYSTVIKGFSATISPTVIESIYSDPRIKQVTLDTMFTNSASSQANARTPSNARIGISYNPSRGSGTQVAILDSGIDDSHPLLAGKVLNGVNCTGGTATNTGDLTVDGLGTQVAGIIAAERDDSVGVGGIAPGAQLLPVKTIDDSGRQSAASLLCGLDFVTLRKLQTGGRVIAVVGQPVPLTSSVALDPVRLAIRAASQAGVVLIAAAGDGGGQLTAQSPSAFPEVITVTALVDTDGLPCARGLSVGNPPKYFDDSFWDRSNYVDPKGAFVEGKDPIDHVVAAPGFNVGTLTRGSVPGERAFTIASGTRIAAAHVAGIAASVPSTTDLSGDAGVSLLTGHAPNRGMELEGVGNDFRGECNLVPRTSLSAPVTLPASSIAVDSTNGFQDFAKFDVGGQTVVCTSRNSTTFFGCSGGYGSFAMGTVVRGDASHVDLGLEDFDHPQQRIFNHLRESVIRMEALVN